MASDYDILNAIKTHLVGHESAGLVAQRVRIADVDPTVAEKYASIDGSGVARMVVFLTPQPYADALVSGDNKEGELPVVVTIVGRVNPEAETGELEQILPQVDTIIEALEELEPNSLTGAQEFLSGVRTPIGFEDKDTLAGYAMEWTVRRRRSRAGG